jgi:hypothetical protein
LRVLFADKPSEGQTMFSRSLWLIAITASVTSASVATPATSVAAPPQPVPISAGELQSQVDVKPLLVLQIGDLY